MQALQPRTSPWPTPADSVPACMFINLEKERTEQYEDESPSELAAHNASNRHCGRHFRVCGYK